MNNAMLNGEREIFHFTVVPEAQHLEVTEQTYETTVALSKRLL